MPQNAHTQYTADLTAHLKKYHRATFPQGDELLDAKYSKKPRNPPVFTKDAAHQNLLLPPDNPALSARIRDLVPPNQRHKWYRSMKSSQALAQSVFGALVVYDHLDCLTQIAADDGGLAFGSGPFDPADVKLEYSVGNLLHEPQPTSVDVWMPGRTLVCVECKMTEAEVGACSRPGKKKHAHPCDGTYTYQAGRVHRCALAADGVDYWDHIPAVLKWDVKNDASPCPLRRTYQLVRNVLAATVEGGRVVAGRGHALLVYDVRNPVFQPHAGGTFEKLREQLIEPDLLRRCSWQRIIAAMADFKDLRWLVHGLEEKYGIQPL